LEWYFLYCLKVNKNALFNFRGDNMVVETFGAGIALALVVAVGALVILGPLAIPIILVARGGPGT